MSSIMKGLVREDPRYSWPEDNLYSARQAQIFKDLGDGYYLGDDSYKDDDGFTKEGYTVYYKEGEDQFRQVSYVSMSPYDNPPGHIEREIEKIIQKDKSRLKENKRIIGHDAKDPQIAVKGGAGSYTLSALKKKALGEIKELVADVQAGKFKVAAYNVNQLKNTLETIAEAEDEMEKSYFNESSSAGMKKKNGKKVPNYVPKKSVQEVADTRTTANQTGGFITPEHDKAYATLKIKAPELYNYIRNEAPVPLDPIMALQAIRHMGSERAVINMIKREIAKDTERMYDKNHPALTENVKRLWKKIFSEASSLGKRWSGYSAASFKSSFDAKLDENNYGRRMRSCCDSPHNKDSPT